MITLRWPIPNRHATRLFTAVVAQGSRRARPSRPRAGARADRGCSAGLGSPVMQYLAGAGVGFLGLVDDDVLDASNLHRQPLYALSDVGKSKVELARAALAQLNPQVQRRTSRRSTEQRQCPRIDPRLRHRRRLQRQFPDQVLHQRCRGAGAKAGSVRERLPVRGPASSLQTRSQACLPALPMARCVGRRRRRQLRRSGSPRARAGQPSARCRRCSP